MDFAGPARERSRARARARSAIRSPPLYRSTACRSRSRTISISPALPTTAGCPAYAYSPARSATGGAAPDRRRRDPDRQDQLDQFATGLVGTRSPYGACSSVFDARYISGGSSSGSAVAVAAGLVSFSLGTDTAGSGRVPAAFNGSGRAQADARPAEHAGRGSGLPHARLRFDLRAHLRRRARRC